jgi:hypothetical protein
MARLSATDGSGRDDVQDGTSESFGGSRPALPGRDDPGEPVPEQVRALLAAARELSDACADLADALRPAPARGADPLTMDYTHLRAERTADLLDEAASISRGTFGLLDSAYAALTDQHTPASQRPRPGAPPAAGPDLVTRPIPITRRPDTDTAPTDHPAATWTPAPPPADPPPASAPTGTPPPLAAAIPAEAPRRSEPTGAPVPGPTGWELFGPPAAGADTGRVTPPPIPFQPVPVPAVTVPPALPGTPAAADAADEPVVFAMTPVPAVRTPEPLALPEPSRARLVVAPVVEVTTPEPITFGPPALVIQPVPEVSTPEVIITAPEPEPEPYEVHEVSAVSAVPPIVPVRAVPDPPEPEPAPTARPAEAALEELFLLAADPAGPMAKRDDQPEESAVAEPAGQTPAEPAAQWPATWSAPGASARPPLEPIPQPRDSTWPDAFVEQKTRTDLPVPAAFAQPAPYEPAEAATRYPTNPRGHYEDFLPADQPPHPAGGNGASNGAGAGATVTPLPSHDEPTDYGLPPGSGELDLQIEDPANPATLAVLARQIEAARRHLQAAVVVGHKLATSMPAEAALGVVEQLLADLTQVARATRESMPPGLVDRTFPGEARFLCALPWERSCLVSADGAHEPAAPHGLAKLLTALGYDADTTSGVGGARGVAVHSPRYAVHIALVEPAGGGRQRWSGALEWIDPNGVTRTWAETLGPVELDEDELARRVDELVRRCVGPQT